MTAKPVRLLLLEDNEGDALLVQLALAQESPGEFTVTTAERLADALERIDAEPFDAMLCDLGLPDSEGLATSRAIVARAPTLPLVVLTGSHDQDLGRAAIEIGAQDYLIKDETRRSIARTLRYAMERKRLEIELRAANEALEHRVAERTAELDMANRALRESEAHYRQLFEANPHPMWVFDLESLAFLAVNDAAVAHYGWSRAEFLAMNLRDLRAPEEIPALFEHLASENGESIRTVKSSRHCRKDGTLIDVEISSHAVDFGGRRARIAAAYDITEQNRAETTIKNYVAQLKMAFMSTVEVATTLSEMRDPYTVGHERRVGEIAVAIGAELGFGDSQQEGLRVAGLLHDIGKITVPAEILSKPGKLTPLEYQLIMQHAQASYDVLKDVQFPWPVAKIALQHHERMDGSGYPEGLKGEAILLEARIIAVADIIEAMSAHRPYRAALGIEAALAEIERGRGTAFDPMVAGACLRLFREKGYVIPA